MSWGFRSLLSRLIGPVTKEICSMSVLWDSDLDILVGSSCINCSYLNDFRKNSVSRKWLINLVVKEQGEHFLVARQNHFILFVSPIQRISMRSESGAPDGLLKMFWICLWDSLLCWTVPKDLNESRRFLWWLLCIFRVLSPLIQHFCIHWAAKYLISGIRYVRIRWMKINLCA